MYWYTPHDYSKYLCTNRNYQPMYVYLYLLPYILFCCLMVALNPQSRRNISLLEAIKYHQSVFEFKSILPHFPFIPLDKLHRCSL